MTVLIPMGWWQEIIPECWESVRRQTVQDKIIVCVVEGEKTENQNVRLKNIVRGRNRLVDFVKEEKYSAFVDRDVILLHDDLLEMMRDFLDSHSDYGVVGLSSRERTDIERPDHIPLHCVVARKEVWDSGIRFKEVYPCECLSFIQDVRQAGFKMGYLRNRADVKHLHIFL